MEVQNVATINKIPVVQLFRLGSKTMPNCGKEKPKTQRQRVRATRPLALPEGDNILYCHFNWIQRIIPPATIQKCLEYADENYSEDNIKRRRIIDFTMKFNRLMSRATLRYLRKNYSSAALLLEWAETLILLECESLQSLKPDHLESDHLAAFNYIVLANRAILNFRRNRHIEAREMIDRLKKIYFVCLNPKSRAMIFALKALFYDSMEALGELEALWCQVRALDPDVPEYLEWMFLAIRKARLGLGNKIPRILEIELITKAYELCSFPLPSPLKKPEVFSLNISMSILCEDILNAREIMTQQDIYKFLGKSVPRTQIGTVLFKKMVSHASKAFDECPTSAAAALRSAEVYCYSSDPETGVWDEENLVNARELYLKCLREWPTNSEVLHKAGLFYCKYGDNGDPKVGIKLPCTNSMEQGIKLLRDAMELDKCNIKALKDYFRYGNMLHNRTNNGSEINLTGVNNLIKNRKEYLRENYPRSSILAQLLCLQATVLCKKYEFHEAFSIWNCAALLCPKLLTSNTHLMLQTSSFPVFTRDNLQKLRQYVQNVQMLESNRIERCVTIFRKVTEETEEV